MDTMATVNKGRLLINCEALTYTGLSLIPRPKSQSCDLGLGRPGDEATLASISCNTGKNLVKPIPHARLSMSALQVSDVCERQLASQHKLAPGLRTDTDATTEGKQLADQTQLRS